MTPKEWLQSELAKVGLTMRDASRIVGKNKNYISGMKDLDEMDAITAMTDVNRYLQGKEPIHALEKERKRKMSKKMKENWKKRKREQQEEYDDGFCGYDW